MSRKSKRQSQDAFLVNKLTVGHALHLVKTEGGSLATGQIVFRAATVVLVAIFTARAIVVGKATAWHLFLPIVGEYLVLLAALPLVNLVLRDADLKRDAGRSLRLLGSMALLVSLWIASRAFDEGSAWAGQGRIETQRLLDWITAHQMHWPILGASVAMAASIPGRVAAFRRHGPPFLAVGMGCAMRIVVVLFGCFLVPVIAADPGRIVWAIWSVLLLAELGALAMHWDLQRRLAKRGIAV